MGPLKNYKRERFCLELASGLTQTEAARKAGYSTKWSTILRNRLMNYEDIKERLKELREITSNEYVASIMERKETLTGIMRSKIARDRDKIDAIAELNKMDGAYAPTRVETKSEQIQIKAIEYFDGDDDKPMRVIENR